MIGQQLHQRYSPFIRNTALSELDRIALATRNLQVAEQKQRRTTKQKLRGALLAGFATLPVKKQTGGTGRILLIRPDHLGDLLLTVPAIRSLKQARPDLTLHACVGNWGKPAIERLTELEHIETVEFPGFTRQPKTGALAPYQLANQTAQTLRKIGYDAAIILRPDHWWGAMVAHMAGIPQIIGFDTDDTRYFLTQRLPHAHTLHSVEKNMLLMSVLTHQKLATTTAKMYYPLTDADHAQADALLTEFGVNPHQPILCIHVGSGTQTKQWEAQRWGAVGYALAQTWGAFIIFTGSASERALCEAAAHPMSASYGVAAGKTTLGGLAALLAKSKVVLGPDSGPLHLASAVQAPTVALFGPASTQEFATWGEKSRHAVLTSDIGCLGCRILDWPDDAPENHPCVRDITIEQVITAALKVAR